MNICVQAHEWGARNFEDMLMYATRQEHREVCELAHEWIIESAPNSDEMLRIMNRMLRDTVHHNSMQYATLAREWGARDFQMALYEAAGRDYIDYCSIMRLWIEESGGVIDVNAMVGHAAWRMSMRALNLAHRWSRSFGVALDIPRMLEAARTPENRAELEELVRDWERADAQKIWCGIPQ